MAAGMALGLSGALVMSIAALSGVALADTPPARPAQPQGLTPSQQQYFDELVGNQGSWAPQGAALVASGFDPSLDAFGFMNYGDDLTWNQLFFQQPTRLGRTRTAVAALTRRDMRTVYGDGVCVSPTPAPGDCQLTESAEQVRIAANQWGRAGHCFAMVASAAGLMNGSQPRTAYARRNTTAGIPLTSRTQRVLARLTMAAHTTTQGYPSGSMASFIQALSASVKARNIENALLLYGVPGSHAVLPLSVLDRGAGQFDVAVYDPSVPLRKRAIHVDTRANTWEYQGVDAPGQPILYWSSTDPRKPATLFLGIIADKYGQQACAFCVAAGRSDLRTAPRTAPSSGATVVTFSPVLAENSAIFDSLTLTDPQGSPLDPTLYSITPPTDGAGTSYANGPSITVASGIDFVVRLSGAGVRVPEPFTLMAIKAGDVRTVRLDRLTQTLESEIQISSDVQNTRVSAISLSRVTAKQSLEIADTSYLFVATQSASDGRAALNIDVSRERPYAVIRSRSDARATLSINLRSTTTTSQATSSQAYRRRQVDVPMGAQLIVDYASWHGVKGLPRLWLDLASDGTRDRRIPLSPVAPRSTSPERPLR